MNRKLQQVIGTDVDLLDKMKSTMSTNDYLNFCRMILNKGSMFGHQILKSETLDLRKIYVTGIVNKIKGKNHKPIHGPVSILFIIPVEFLPGNNTR